MNKIQFMQSLKLALPHVSPTELTDIMADFEEHFASGLAHGKSEAEICAELGSPYEIAQQYQEGMSTSYSFPPQTPQANTVQQPVQQVLYPQAAATEKQQQPVKGPSKINEGALVLVIVLNVLIGIPIWISLYSTLFGLWAAAGGIGVAAAVLFAVAIVQAGVTSLILALFGLAITALTVLAVILMVYLTKWLTIGLVKYIRWNRDLVMGGSPA